MKRAERVQQYREIQMLRAMTMAQAPYRKLVNISSSYTKRVTENLKDALISMRQDQRNRNGDPLNVTQNYIKRHEQLIKRAVNEVLSDRNGTEFIEIGKNVWMKRNGRTLSITIGHLWYKRVFNELYASGNKENWRLQNAKDYFILSATEYKINIPEVRFWKAKAFHLKTGKMVDGYVGQSKIGKQLCAFRTNGNRAMTLAEEFGLKEIDKKLSPELEKKP